MNLENGKRDVSNDLDSDIWWHLSIGIGLCLYPEALRQQSGHATKAFKLNDNARKFINEF